MWRNRLAYLCMTVLLFTMVFFFSKPFLLYAGIAFLLIALICRIGCKRESRQLKIKTLIRSGGREGKEIPVTLEFTMPHKPYIIRYVLVELEIKNNMFEISTQKRLLFFLGAQKSCAELSLPVSMCGEMEVTCTRMQVYDFLKLFARDLPVPHSAVSVIYPEEKNLHVQGGRKSAGVPKDDGMVQNRKGNDPSEIFDIREYTPGDDIRAIHWKLSSKTDKWILRQASDPAHYHTVLLPDFGQNELEMPEAKKLLNAAAGYVMALGRGMGHLGSAFCVALPTDQGLKICEVKNEQQFRQAVQTWMRLRVPKIAGTGLRYFQMEHLEQRFTRMILVSAGEASKNLNGLDRKMDVTLVTVSDTERMKTSVSGKCEIVELPVKQQEKESYHIVC